MCPCGKPCKKANATYCSRSCFVAALAQLGRGSDNKLIRGGIRLPCTATNRNLRNQSFAKLLYNVKAGANSGFDFEGKLMKPGVTVEEAALWPDDRYPPTPVLLEYVVLPGRASYNAPKEQLYVLWKWTGEEWQELCQSVGLSCDWVIVMGPAAILALRDGRAPVVPVPIDLSAIEARILEFMDAELKPLPESDYHHLIGSLHNRLAARACQRAA